MFWENLQVVSSLLNSVLLNFLCVLDLVFRTLAIILDSDFVCLLACLFVFEVEDLSFKMAR